MPQQTFKTIRRKIKYTLLFGFVIFIIRISNMVSRKAWLHFCGTLGQIIHCLAPGLRKQVNQHLSLAYTEKTTTQIQQLSEQVLIMLGRNAGSVIRNFSISAEEKFRETTIVSGLIHAEEAYHKGNGVIFLTAHLGPFESIASELSLRGYNPFIVGTPLKDKKLNELLIKHRTKFGAVAIDRGKDTYRVIKNIVSGGTMAILIDQDTRVKSVFVDFFGRPCATPVGAAMIALKTRAAVIPVFARLNADGLQEITYYPEVKITKTGNEAEDMLINTQRLTNLIEDEIRKYPAQWLWMHKRWKTPRLHEVDILSLKKRDYNKAQSVLHETYVSTVH